tara:strand:+ start:8258 stop:8614 length:357 start_codon:yes stop_codon:yes gene_type:complete
MELQEANEIINNIIGEKVVCTKEDGSTVNHTIKRVIPMHRSRGGDVYDVEILLNKTRNSYFSCNSVKDGRSWVKGIVFKNEKAKGLRKLKSQPIAKYIRSCMSDQGLLTTAKALKELR